MSDPKGFKAGDTATVSETGKTVRVTGVGAGMSPPIWCDDGRGYFPTELTSNVAAELPAPQPVSSSRLLEKLSGGLTMSKGSICSPGFRVGLDFGGGAPSHKTVNVHVDFDRNVRLRKCLVPLIDMLDELGIGQWKLAGE